MVLFYNLIFLIYALMYMPVLILRGKWHKGFLARLGIVPKNFDAVFAGKKNIWIHAVSVGEVLAVIGLVEKIRKGFPQYNIVLSTVTKTGHALAREKLPDVTLIYAPLDFSWATRRFVSAINPVLYILAETEIWPNLFAALYQHGVPIIMVNGRISDKAYVWYRRAAFIFKAILEKVDVFCMQSADDADKIMNIGASPEKVKIVGNVKFDSVQDPPVPLSNIRYAPTDVVLVGGSTHPGEEDVLLGVMQSLRPNFPSLRLLIAPRHIERTKEVEAVVREHGFKSERFSRIQGRPDPEAVVVVDTIGHLRSLYGIASLVFVGKSLTGWGGQNVLEPASFGKPIVVGPNMQNFRHIMALFKEKNAIVQVDNAQDLKNAVSQLLHSPQDMDSLGVAAKEVVKSHQGATERTYQVIHAKLSF